MAKRNGKNKNDDIKQAKDVSIRSSEAEYDAYLVDLMIGQGCPQTWQGTWEERHRS